VLCNIVGEEIAQKQISREHSKSQALMHLLPRGFYLCKCGEHSIHFVLSIYSHMKTEYCVRRVRGCKFRLHSQFPSSVRCYSDAESPEATTHKQKYILIS
jgi:hypothetical protein